MKAKLILLITIYFLSTCLFAQYNEKQILLKNASDMTKVRKYSLAEEIYSEALTKFPNDVEVITELIEHYIRTNNSEKGTDLYKTKGDLLPKSKGTQYQITFSLLDKNYEIALAKALEYLKVNNSETEYKTFGSLFQRYRAYSEATQIFLSGDKLYTKKFSIDIAESYYYERDYDEAIKYYLSALENNVGSKSLGNSRISNIIKVSPNSILTLIDYFGTDSDKLRISKDNLSIINIYVDALLNTGRDDIAFSILEKYQSKDVYTKAEQFRRIKKYNISKKLYQLTLEKEDDLNSYYRYLFNFANMRFESGAYVEADSLIDNIILVESNKRFKANVMFESYLLKAEITHRNKNMSNQYEKLLKKAEEYANNSNQKKILKAKFSYYKILTLDFPQAKRYLDELGRLASNDNYYFNYYLYEVFQAGKSADSLATELIILAPESDFTIEMLELKYILKSLNQKDKNLFLDAYRKEKLFSIEDADSLYQEIYKSTKNEYFLIKNALINKANNNIQRSRELLSYNFNDTFCHDFAALQLVLLEDDNSQIAKDMARNFLTQYPNSSFAAQIRQILMINQNN